MLILLQPSKNAPIVILYEAFSLWKKIKKERGEEVEDISHKWWEDPLIKLGEEE